MIINDDGGCRGQQSTCGLTNQLICSEGGNHSVLLYAHQINWMNSHQGRINHSGVPYQRKAGGPFLIRVARIFCGGALFFPQKLTTFLVVVVTFKPTLNVQTSKQRGKNLAIDGAGGPLAAGAPSHGTTGTIVDPALTLIMALS